MIWLVAVAMAGTVDDGAERLAAGDVPGALAAFQEQANQGPASAALAYDLGNTWYQSGDPARAIAWWRLSRMLAPRDTDAAHNLAWVRGELHLPPAVRSPVGWTEFVTPGELGLPAWLLLTAGAAGAVVARARRSQGATVLPWAAVAGMGLLGTSIAVYGENRVTSCPIGVVVDDAAQVRTTPSTEAAESFSLPVGAEVQVEAERAGFLRIACGDGRRGWVPNGALLVVSPAANPLG
jgi:hypothetical protein